MRSQALDDAPLTVLLGHNARVQCGLEFDLKDEAKRLIDSMPKLTSWGELMYEIYVRQTIEAGLADSDAGRTQPVEAVRERFNLPK